MLAPKDSRANSRYRRAILERAASDVDFQRECWARSSRDMIWYIDTFGWIYAPKDHGDCPDQPFVTYPFQERGMFAIDAAIGNYPMLGEKSRDMGFTWMVTAVAAWRFHFRRKQSFLFGSRKEEYVDKTGDPKTLFWKIDYFFEHLPGWLQPNIDRTSMHLANLENGSTIDGESTNDNFARGDRRNAIFLDEFPAVDNGQQIAKAAGDASNCVIYFGTPMGTAGAFYEIRQKMLEETPERVLRLHWSEHPEKRIGLYNSERTVDGSFKLHKLSPESEYPPEYKFRLDGRLRSLAYDERERRAPNRRVMAQEWDIDYMASAWQLFDPVKLAEIKAKWARAPQHRGDVLFDPDWKNPRWIANERGGYLQLWFSPDSDGKVPRIWKDVIIGCDTGLGTAGEFGSSSVASIVRRSTGEKLAQFTSHDLSPTDFCRRVLALCTWFNNAYLIWESNGPGGLFTAEVKKSGYRNVFYSDANLRDFIDKKTQKPGWHSTKDGKKILLEDYSNALVEGAFKNYCAEAIEEAGQYIHEPNGVIIHAKAKGQRKDDADPTEAGENHGDMVIADALANFGIADLTKREIERPVETPPPPPGSFGARSLAAREALNKLPRKWGSFRRRSPAKDGIGLR